MRYAPGDSVSEPVAELRALVRRKEDLVAGRLPRIDVEQLVCTMNDAIEPVSFRHGWRAVAAWRHLAGAPHEYGVMLRLGSR